MADRIFIGVAWPYANGPLHVGHLAGAYLPADIFARYHRLAGNDVLMVSGSDCHGTPITLQAERDGVEPASVIRRYHESFLTTFSKLGISFDLFTQTYTENHYEVTSKFFSRLLEKYYLTKKTVTGAYSPTLARFLPDRYVEGRCPNCGSDRARGDQCDRCGRVHEAEELIEPRSTLDDAPVTFRDTEHFLLDLARLEPDIRDWLTGVDRSHWRPNTLKFTENWLRAGLKDRAITRDIEWGVPVPVDEPGFRQKRIYVWFDAVIGYLSASMEWAGRLEQADRWRDWWNLDGSQTKGVRSYYFIGKDNIPFHTIIWPALLAGYGTLALPYDVPANEFLNLEGRKMSTSEGWALFLPAIEDRYEADQLRYYLAANAPESRDANWSWKDFVDRTNNELVGVWGNLAHRTLGLAWRTYGRVPEPGTLESADRELLLSSEEAFRSVGSDLEKVRIRSALQEALAVAHHANLYLAQQEPWKLLKSDPVRAATVLYTALQVVDHLSILLSPFLPHSSHHLRTMLGYTDKLAAPVAAPTCDEFGERNVLAGAYASTVRWKPSQLAPGQVLAEPRPLFRKLDTDVVDEELARLRSG